MQKNIKYEFNKATLDRRVLYTFFLFLVSLYFVVQSISPTTYRKYGEGRFVSFQSIKKVEAFIYKGGRNKVLYIHLKNREVLYIPMHSIGKKPFEILFQELETIKSLLR